MKRRHCHPLYAHTPAPLLSTAPQTLSTLLPAAGERVGPSLGALVPLLASSLGSAQDRLRATAAGALDALGASGVDPGLLLQHYAHVVACGSGRGRGALVERIAELAPEVGAGRKN